MRRLLVISLVFVSIFAQAQQLAVKDSLKGPRPCKTFRSYNNPSQGFTMKTQTLPGELLSSVPLSDLSDVETPVSVYSTNPIQMGKFKFSCDYIFNDEGRLVDCEPTWQFGK